MLPFFFFLLGTVHGSHFSCKDQSNKDVDWFAVYKMPKITGDNSIKGIADGLGFYYTDPKDAKGSLHPSKNDISTTKQAVAYTLQQFYDQQKDKSIFYMMYSDDPWDPSKDTIDPGSCPDENDGDSIPERSAQPNFGHTKGTLFFNKNSGVWLSHSVRYFPKTESYAYSKCGRTNAQDFLCMTFDYSQLNNIGKQLCYDNPYIYSSNLPSDIAAANPDLTKAMGNKCDNGYPWSSVIDLKTAGGTVVTSFAKSKQFNKDLYDSFIAEYFKQDIDAQTWKRNGGPIPITYQKCQTYHTLDALILQVGVTPAYSYTKDHSKWAISTDPKNLFVCIGDINREMSQYVREGGSNCITSKDLWNAYNVITKTNDCPTSPNLGPAILRFNRTQ